MKTKYLHLGVCMLAMLVMGSCTYRNTSSYRNVLMEGVVVDSDGKPVANMHMKILDRAVFQAEPWTHIEELLEAGETTTDAEGRFSVKIRTAQMVFVFSGQKHSATEDVLSDTCLYCVFRYDSVTDFRHFRLCIETFTHYFNWRDAAGEVEVYPVQTKDTGDIYMHVLNGNKLMQFDVTAMRLFPATSYNSRRRGGRNEIGIPIYQRWIRSHKFSDEDDSFILHAIFPAVTIRDIPYMIEQKIYQRLILYTRKPGTLDTRIFYIPLALIEHPEYVPDSPMDEVQQALMPKQMP